VPHFLDQTLAVDQLLYYAISALLASDSSRCHVWPSIVLGIYSILAKIVTQSAIHHYAAANVCRCK